LKKLLFWDFGMATPTTHSKTDSAAQPADKKHAGGKAHPQKNLDNVASRRVVLPAFTENPGANNQDSLLQHIEQIPQTVLDRLVQANTRITDKTGLPAWAPSAALMTSVAASLVAPAVESAYQGINFQMRATAAPAPNEFGIEFHGAMTPEYRLGMVEGYQQIPESVRNYLREQGTRISIGATRDDIHPENGKAYLQTHLDDTRVHQNQASGVYYGGSNEVVVTQLEYNTERRPEIGERPDARGIAKGNWLIKSAQASTNVLRHEVGHAIDAMCGGISNSPGFRQAYEADVAALGGADTARKKGWAISSATRRPIPAQWKSWQKGGPPRMAAGLWGQGLRKDFQDRSNGSHSSKTSLKRPTPLAIGLKSAS
jgi:hypothetical protein